MKNFNYKVKNGDKVSMNHNGHIFDGILDDMREYSVTRENGSIKPFISFSIMCGLDDKRYYFKSSNESDFIFNSPKNYIYLRGGRQIREGDNIQTNIDVGVNGYSGGGLSIVTHKNACNDVILIRLIIDICKYLTNEVENKDKEYMAMIKSMPDDDDTILVENADIILLENANEIMQKFIIEYNKSSDFLKQFINAIGRLNNFTTDHLCYEKETRKDAAFKLFGYNVNLTKKRSV